MKMVVCRMKQKCVNQAYLCSLVGVLSLPALTVNEYSVVRGIGRPRPSSYRTVTIATGKQYVYIERIRL